MFDFLLSRIAATPWYLWSLAFAWGAIETAGWLRVRNSRKRRSRQARGEAALEGFWARLRAKRARFGGMRHRVF